MTLETLQPALASCLLSLVLVACDSEDASVSGTATSGEAGDGSGSETGDSQEVCDPGEEDIVLGAYERFEPFESLDESGEVPCVVTPAGFDCDGELFDVDALFEPFAPVPWEQNQNVGLTTNAYFFAISELVVRSEDGDLLGVAAWRPSGIIDPISVSLGPTVCEPDDSGVLTLRATYSIEGESISLVGARSGALAGFEIFQAAADDITSVSAGEIGESVSFVAVATP